MAVRRWHGSRRPGIGRRRRLHWHRAHPEPRRRSLHRISLGQGRPTRSDDPVAVRPVRSGRGVAWHERRRRSCDQPDGQQPPRGSACLRDSRHRRFLAPPAVRLGRFPAFSLRGRRAGRGRHAKSEHPEILLRPASTSARARIWSRAASGPASSTTSACTTGPSSRERSIETEADEKRDDDQGEEEREEDKVLGGQGEGEPGRGDDRRHAGRRPGLSHRCGQQTHLE